MNAETKRFIGWVTTALMGEEQKLRNQEHTMLVTKDLEGAFECAVKADTVHETIGVIFAEAKRFEETDE